MQSKAAVKIPKSDTDLLVLACFLVYRIETMTSIQMCQKDNQPMSMNVHGDCKLLHTPEGSLLLLLERSVSPQIEVHLEEQWKYRHNTHLGCNI